VTDTDLPLETPCTPCRSPGSQPSRSLPRWPWLHPPLPTTRWSSRLANGERIRLHGVDAPELDQPYGDQATALINRLVAGQHVDIRPTGDLSYGRTVADIIVEDGPNAGTDAGAYMVRNGYAWVESRWNLNPAAPSLQAEAQAAHRGLWAASDAIPPWVWRHQYAQPWQSYHSHTAWRR
jgi:micrococcal nuclease